MEECVFIDGVRTPNGRAHAEKGWFRKLRPDELLTATYDALFERNKAVKPEDIDAIMVGCANITGMQNDIGRLGWLAGGYPESVPSNTITNQCPSGMAATMHAARAIITGEADIMIAAGAEDMEKVPMAANMDFPPRLFSRYNLADFPMGSTAEKVAEMYKISREDMDNMAIWSNKKAAAARDAGKFKNEIVPIKGLDDAGNEFLVEHDQWIRDKVDPAKMASMKSPFKPDGNVTAATSSPLTQGACCMLMMSRKKADALGLSYTYKYSYGVLGGCDPTIMGMAPVPAVQKLFARTGLGPQDIGAVELNEAFASQALACIRELKLDKDNAPFDKVNMWGGAIALGHPLGESGARIIVTLLNVLKTDAPDAKYGLASLCGAFGNGGALLVEKV
ncbi:thiolase family protein [Desulfosudis oleivorans]|uniref:acetyl-CoA C-acyltransferase n=1 Tax=Desulfosudis oleivorans (strain DSM 6200 / JCM 39069 / Hxd3) TaxID=96561 RepID=A8ZS16_DESOH|nr:thiolase family protein [Desulfosudis oleivorans]ABW66034.1 acetyl-CoA acetyltransferase [Desulfosudis oleivorans Hxd3]